MRRVRVRDALIPKPYHRTPCPTCGQPRETINGAYLRWRRERAGLDQRTLAARLSVSGPYLSDIERNRRACSPEIVAAYYQLPERREQRRRP